MELEERGFQMSSREIVYRTQHNKHGELFQV